MYVLWRESSTESRPGVWLVDQEFMLMLWGLQVNPWCRHFLAGCGVWWLVVYMGLLQLSIPIYSLLYIEWCGRETHPVTAEPHVSALYWHEMYSLLYAGSRLCCEVCWSIPGADTSWQIIVSLSGHTLPRICGCQLHSKGWRTTGWSVRWVCYVIYALPIASCLAPSFWLLHTCMVCLYDVLMHLIDSVEPACCRGYNLLQL